MRPCKEKTPKVTPWLVRLLESPSRCAEMTYLFLVCLFVFVPSLKSTGEDVPTRTFKMWRCYNRSYTGLISL